MSGDELITSADVAAMYAVSVSTLAHWRKNGYGPAHIQLTRRAVRYRRSVVVAWLAAQERSAQGQAAS